MSDPEETSAQRQARIRRQKREAKINTNATERLDKITRLSGRTPESVRQQAPPSLAGASTPPTKNDAQNSAQPNQTPPQMPDASNPEQAKMQEEYLRALLRGPSQNGAQGPGQGQPALSEQDDPLKMLSSLIGGMNNAGDPDAPQGSAFNPEQFSKATGMPPFLTNMLMGNQQAPPTPAEIKTTRMWRVLHVTFALLSGIYHLLAIGWAESSFGANPPAPATFQNPFVVFVLGEILLQTARILTSGPSGKSGPGLWMQMVREFAGDGAVTVFLLGIASWWKGVT